MKLIEQVEIAREKPSRDIAAERLILEDPSKSKDERNTARPTLENLEIEERYKKEKIILKDLNHLEKE